MTDAPKRIWAARAWAETFANQDERENVQPYILATPEALAASPEVQRLITEAVERATRVKPLVWEQYCINAGNSSALAFGGEYVCERAGKRGHYGLWFPADGPSAEPRSYHAELEAAKAAAQADYEQRIRAAIGGDDHG